MRSFASSTMVQAAPEAIWCIRTEAVGYPPSNTTVSRVDGLIDLGARITVHAKVAPGRALPATVVALDAPDAWCGSVVCRSACLRESEYLSCTRQLRWSRVHHG